MKLLVTICQVHNFFFTVYELKKFNFFKNMMNDQIMLMGQTEDVMQTKGIKCVRP